MVPTARPSEQDARQDTAPPHVGLALSGGGAKGFAHIGVLAVLDEAGVPIDAVAGTSMGAVIGGLYAIGYTPEMLADVATGQDWEALFTDAEDRGSRPIETKLMDTPHLLALPIRSGRVELPLGLVAGQRISQLFARLTWPAHAVRDFHRLPIPFVALATDLESGEPVVLDRGVLPEAMRASISLPSIFAPVDVGDRVLIDGGFSRNLPAQDARALGAEVVICSDVSDPLQEADSLRTLLQVLDQTMLFRTTALTEEQRTLCDVVVRPDVQGLSRLRFDRAEEWMRRGAAAARAALPNILALTNAAPDAAEERERRRVARARPQLIALDSVLVDAVTIGGLDRAPGRFVRRALDLEPPVWVTPDRLDRAVARLYASGLFASVFYRLDGPGAGEGGATLTVEVEEAARDHLGFNFRYESRYKASLQLSATLRHLLAYGSFTRFRLRLGEQIQAGASHYRRTGPGRALSVGADLEFTRSPFDLFQRGRRVAEVRADVYSAAGFAGLALGSSALVGLRLKGEYANAKSAIAAEIFDEDDLYYTVAAEFSADTHDRPLFPTRGVRARAIAEWADRDLGGGATFSQQVVDIDARLPVGGAVTLLSRATLGAARGPDLPGHYLFFLGGAAEHFIYPHRQFTFFGLDTQELRGRSVEYLAVGLQVRVVPRVFVTMLANAGGTFVEPTFDFDRYEAGYGITLGARTVLGQLTLTLAETDLSEWPDISIDLGHPF